MSSKDQEKLLGHNMQLQEGQRSLQDHGNNPGDAEMSPPDNPKDAKNGYPPPTPILKSVVIAPSSPAAISEHEPNRPASQKLLDPTLSGAPQASGSRDAQIPTHDQQLHQQTSQTADGQGASISRSLSNEQPVQQSAPPKGATALATAQIDQLTAFWEKYNAIGDKEDKEFVASAGGDLDNLLIFAGLFSAVDTAFIIESYKSLKPDPVDEATKLLRSVVLLLRDPTHTNESATPSFTATARDVRVNCLLFASLCCSLSVAFGAVLAKQWLTQYDQDGGGSLKTPAARGREWQGKYEGRSKWHLEDVIVTLPTLLQLSLFLFLVGLADFVWPLNTPVASIIIVFASATFMFYTITILISVIDCSAPFQTRLSAVLSRVPALATSIWAHIRIYSREFHYQYVLCQPLWKWICGALWAFLIKPTWFIVITGFCIAKDLFSRVHCFPTTPLPGDQDTGALLPRVESRCVVHLLERMTVSEDLTILAEAVDSLPDNLGLSEIAVALTTFHLKPTLNSRELRFPGLQGQSWRAIAKMIHFVLRSPNSSGLGTLSIQGVPLQNNIKIREALALALWDTFLAHPGDQEVYDSTRHSYLALSRAETRPTGFVSWNFLARDGIVSNLKAAAVQEHTLRLLCLLPSIGCHLGKVVALLRTTASESPHLPNTLQSTMWEAPSHKPDLEIFWLAMIRVEVLSSYHLDALVDCRFPEYLASWFNHFSVPDWETRFPDPRSFRYQQSRQEQRSLYWTYLFSLHHLLTHSENTAWSQELGRTGHLSCLCVILQGYPHDEWFSGESLGLWALLCLWNQEKAQGGSGTSLFLKRECVQLVAESVASCNSRTGWIEETASYGQLWPTWLPRTWMSKVEAGQDVAQLLDWLVFYLEAAKQDGLMDEIVAKLAIVQVYSSWCTEVNLLLPEDRQHTDRSEELRVILLGNVPN